MQRENTLSRYGDLHIQTGGSFMPSWNSAYTSQALPFVIPRMVSGPDYPNKERWRRNFADAPQVSPTEFLRGFARRIEGQVRSDFTALPIVRSTWFQYTVEHLGSMLGPMKAKPGETQSELANEYVDAARILYWHLCK